MGLSKFLPVDFDPSRTVALIAGKGEYPRLVADGMRSAGIAVRLLAISGETSTELWSSFPPGERVEQHAGQLGKMLRHLRDFGARYALMAGQVTPGKLFRGLRPDWKAARLLWSLEKRNAETIFGAIAAEMEKEGTQLLDARAFMDAHLAGEGWMTKPSEKNEPAWLDHAWTVAREVARLDIGQSVVVRKGTVLAVEGFEGTDEMIMRAGKLGKEPMVFVKTVKPCQDFRFDVPVFGSITLDGLAQAKIRTVVLAAEETIMLNKPFLLSEAKRNRIGILGVTVK